MDDALLAQPIVPLNDFHDRRSFDCGVEPLNRYIHAQAGQDGRRHVAVCFVLPDEKRSRIAGYYTLSAFSIVGDMLPEALQQRLPKYGQIPCTLLVRLAIDRDYRAQGLGKHLLVDALKRASVHAGEIASWAVVVDAKDPGSKAFYTKYGFISLPRASRRLFLPMLTITGLFR